MSRPIEDYGLLGDGQTAALVSRDGSIDWLCLPRFSSDACFAALLGTDANGCWRLMPAAKVTKTERRYRTDTMVLETEVEVEGGAVRLIDFMPAGRDDGVLAGGRGRGGPSLVRIVEGVRGRVAMHSDMRLRFDYGSLPPWSEAIDGGGKSQVGPDMVVLRASVPLRVDQQSHAADFSVAAGDRVAFVLSYARAPGPLPPPLDTEAALAETQRFWRGWIGNFDNRRTQWPSVVRRSLLTLKAMIDRESGGLVAAPTASLPEAPGGAMNWDYRYCWLRDASFTLESLLSAGFVDEAHAWRDWLLRAIAGEPGRMRIMYHPDGARHLAEWEVDGLPGYRHSRPVRIGNAAAKQHQIDVFGEVLNCLSLARKGGLPLTHHELVAQRRIVEHLAAVWDTPGSGIWESRAEPRQYTYSKAVAWAGVDGVLRFLQSDAGKTDADDATVEWLTALRQRIHDQTCSEGWNEGIGSFTQYFGGQELDASLLLLPKIGFLPATDPRMASTIEAIRRDLTEGGLVRRLKATPGNSPEGAFLACSCWMADCLDMQGRHAEAHAQFERVLAVANDLGLLAEEYNVPGKHQAGNFPQALSHLAVVSTALRLSGTTPPS